MRSGGIRRTAYFAASALAGTFLMGSLFLSGRGEAHQQNTVQYIDKYIPIDIQPDPTTNTYCALDRRLDSNRVIASKESPDSNGAPVVTQIAEANSSYNDVTISCRGSLVAWGGANGQLGEISYIDLSTNVVETYGQIPGNVTKVL